MQTFLTSPDFRETARHLDYRRLGKQRVEALQLLNCKPGKAWYNHPAKRMWKGYDEALKFYMNCMIEEWIARGYKNTMAILEINNLIFPPWYEDKMLLELVIQSHRSALLRKNRDFYSKYSWQETMENYHWPV